MDDHHSEEYEEYEEDDEYEEYSSHYEDEEDTVNDPEYLQSYGEYDLDPPQSHGCSPENDDYNSNPDDIYDCHDRVNHMSKPHEMVAFMCYRKISDRNQRSYRAMKEKFVLGQSFKNFQFVLRS